MLLFSTPVPTPEATITMDPPQNDPYFAGSHLKLLCSVAVIPAVDLPVIVEANWEKDEIAVTKNSL